MEPEGAGGASRARPHRVGDAGRPGGLAGHATANYPSCARAGYHGAVPVLGSPPRAFGTGFAFAAALAMIAYQVGAKATRDALFLSSFPASALPSMIVVTAVVSIAMAFAVARALSRFGPRLLIPLGFSGSGLLLLGEWALVGRWPHGVAIAVYLHYGALGALLISGFWAYLNERFDPRTAKRAIGRIAAGGTVGGLLGGILAERVASSSPVATMLPILAALHFLCAFLIPRIRGTVTPEDTEPSPGATAHGGAEASPTTGLRVLAGSPYLRTLVSLVVLVTMSECLIDWVFKARAAASMTGGQELLRLFAAFYTGVSLLTVLVQSAWTRPLLERLGLARTVATLPAAVGLGSVGAALWPGLPSAMGLRATQSVLGNALYRAAYESLFTPVAPREKRAAKALIDVGAARSGDFLGAGLVQIVLVGAGMGHAPPAILLLAAAASAAALAVALRLRSGYVGALERGLLSRAIRLDLSEVRDALTRSLVLRSLGGAPLSRSLERGPVEVAIETRAAPPPASADDPLAARRAALSSGRREAVIQALADRPLPAELVRPAIALLAWDEVAREAIAALRAAGSAAVPSLADALTSEESDFAVRRRVPLVLGTVPEADAVAALLRGLADRRFEVRYRCGRALAHLLEHHPRLGLPPEEIFAAVLREVHTERRVWDGQRILDQWDDDMWSPVEDDALRARAGRSLEHVFTLLSLALPRRPLRIAYRGLQTQDPLLRGTALEYLESSLPAEIRKALWPYLEDDRRRDRVTRSPGEALADLLRSQPSIQVHLEELRRGGDTPGDRGGAGRR